MNKAIKITIKKELRGIVRDKKSLLMMLLTPLIIPIFIIMFSFMYDSLLNDAKKEEYLVGVNYNLSEEELNIIEQLNFNVKYYNDIDSMKKSYNSGEISLYVTKDNNNFNIYGNSYIEQSSYSYVKFTQYLDIYNEYIGRNYLNSIGIDENRVFDNITYNYKNIEGSNDLVNEIITIGFIFVIMSITLTAIYCATDSTAGEKERGTLETFLTFPIKSSELITGKFIAIIIACFITALIGTILAVISLEFASKIYDIYNNIILNINYKNIILALFIMFSYSIFVSGLCISLASLCKTYKEAQSVLTPISLLTIIPLFLDILKVELTHLLSLVPIINHAMLLKIIFCKTMQGSDYINVIIMFVSTIIYSIIIIKLITKQYKSDKVLFSS